jgi:hypothetical protein
MQPQRPRVLAYAILAAVLAAGPSAAQNANDPHPNLSGTYLQRSPGAQTFNGFELTPAGQAAFERNKAGIAASDPEIDTALRCEPQGVPRMLSPGPLPFTVMQTTNLIGVVSEAFAQPRLIFFSAEHRKGYWPTYMGDSIAHWEGDVLAIDTVNFIPATFLDMRGLPHSDALHVTERMQLLDDGKTLQDQVTIDDPKYFKKPFTLTHQYARRDDIKIVETVCLNTRTHP